MSGSGGYYKYRCKYWMIYNCPHWVWVNNAACPHCLADGRDEETTMAPPFRISREIYVPQLENGSLQYIIMEIIATSDFDNGWAVKTAAPAQQTFPTSTVPSTVPSIVGFKAMSGIEVPGITKGRLQSSGQVWTGSVDNMEKSFH